MIQLQGPADDHAGNSLSAEAAFVSLKRNETVACKEGSYAHCIHVLVAALAASA